MVPTNHNIIILFFLRARAENRTYVVRLPAERFRARPNPAAHLPIEQVANAAWTGTNPLALEGCDAGEAHFVTWVGVQKCGTRLRRRRVGGRKRGQRRARSRGVSAIQSLVSGIQFKTGAMPANCLKGHASVFQSLTAGRLKEVGRFPETLFRKKLYISKKSEERGGGGFWIFFFFSFLLEMQNRWLEFNVALRSQRPYRL